MGLDVEVYTQIEVVEDCGEAEDGWCPTHVWLYEAGFPARVGSAPVGKCLDAACGFEFRAGSYSGYNDWRRELALLVLNAAPEKVWNNREAYEDRPFYELIEFSDCEGTIGPEASAELAKDFAEYEEMAARRSGQFEHVYRSFKRAFELASEGGAVVFT